MTDPVDVELLSVLASVGESCDCAAAVPTQLVRQAIAELAELRELAYPPTHYETGPEDGDEVCDVCAYSVEPDKHTYQDCVRNLSAVSDQVTDYLGKETSRLDDELAAARNIVEGYALQNDELERESRALGAFDAAVHYQQFSSWLRSGQRCLQIRGTECRMLIGITSNGLVVLRGDVGDVAGTFAIGLACLRLSRVSEAALETLSLLDH